MCLLETLHPQTQHAWNQTPTSPLPAHPPSSGHKPRVRVPAAPSPSFRLRSVSAPSASDATPLPYSLCSDHPVSATSGVPAGCAGCCAPPWASAGPTAPPLSASGQRRFISESFTARLEGHSPSPSRPIPLPCFASYALLVSSLLLLLWIINSRKAEVCASFVPCSISRQKIAYKLLAVSRCLLNE